MRHTLLDLECFGCGDRRDFQKRLLQSAQISRQTFPSAAQYSGVMRAQPILLFEPEIRLPNKFVYDRPKPGDIRGIRLIIFHKSASTGARRMVAAESRCGN